MMEKHRSFSWKSTKFLVFSVTLSFSLVFLSFFSFWVLRTSPFIHQESYVLFNTPTINSNLNSLNIQSLTDSSDFLNNSQFKEHQIVSGFVHNTSIEVNASNKDEVGRKKLTGLSPNFSVNGVKVVNLGKTHLREPQNSSGFVKSFNLKEESGEVSSNNEIKKEKRAKKLSLDGKFVEHEENMSKDCDISKGRWVFDESYPLYTNFSCPFIDEGFDCQGNGRLDKDYMKWRWQPQDCDLPR